MSPKTIMILIIIVCILAFFVYIFITYGEAGVWATIFGIIIIFGFFIWLHSQPHISHEDEILARAEREKARQQEIGRLRGQEEHEKGKMKRQEAERRRQQEYQRMKDFFRKFR